ncbi:unnamed protein product [Mycena citricolor]|uniref:Uncharacterized protein n=1 Tax=Mycena citricolor TaxID=2018698 RepID=A0AAD2HDX8_9AGAR|nr:unnamed protein product [Mycena citricolor]
MQTRSGSPVQSVPWNSQAAGAAEGSRFSPTLERLDESHRIKLSRIASCDTRRRKPPVSSFDMLTGSRLAWDAWTTEYHPDSALLGLEAQLFV